jgi:hypothetical protein
MAFDYRDIDGSVQHVISELTRLDAGDGSAIDFITRKDVNAFCALLGFKGWAGLDMDAIVEASVPDFGPKIVNATQAAQILQVLKTELAKPQGLFKAVNRNILNDFLPVDSAPFNDAPCLGHFWEFQYALAVELEHGKTRGTNVTNNHPVLTGMVAMAHLTEDTLYYARLWVMEGEGECFNAIREGLAPDQKLADLLRGLDRARVYLAKRMIEKATDLVLPT